MKNKAYFFAVIVGLLLSTPLRSQAATELKNPSVYFVGHQANIGWGNPITVPCGSVGMYAGNDNINNWMEAISMKIINSSVSGNINYQAYVSSGRLIGGEWANNTDTWSLGSGYLSQGKNGSTSGTEGISKPMEGLRIWLDGELANGYDVFYRVFQNYTVDTPSATSYVWVQNWSAWVKNGDFAGSMGYACPISAYQVYLMPKKYLQTVNHYIWNREKQEFVLWNQEKKTVEYGKVFTPAYLAPPKGYVNYKKDEAYTVTNDKVSKVYYYPESSRLEIRYPIEIIIGKDEEASYVIGFKGDFLNDKKVVIEEDESFFLEEMASLDKKEPIKFSNELSKKEIKKEELQKDTWLNITGKIFGGEITAGTWQGRINFEIRLE